LGFETLVSFTAAFVALASSLMLPVVACSFLSVFASGLANAISGDEPDDTDEN
jgi:hypothetical protein